VLPGRVAVSDIGASKGKALSHKRIALGVRITVENSPIVHLSDHSRNTRVTEPCPRLLDLCRDV
jgi:hypothetical protein